MRRCLISRLACPECRGRVDLVEVQQENAVRVLQGTLKCTACARPYRIEKGVPRLVKATGDVAEIGQRFMVQWVSRLNGRFEGEERCYGLNDDVYVGWMKEQLESRGPLAAGDWILDAGCGSGEKTRVWARECPRQNVVGLDLGIESLEKAAAQFGELPNVDYVQGNILEPPFQARQFDYGVSIGVLHHTPNTRRAFAAFRQLLKEQTTLTIWIYPTYREGPEWRMPYFARDFLVFNQGPRLPTSLLRLISYGIVIGLYPIVEFFFKKSYRRMGRDLPFFDVDKMTRGQRFNAEIFHLFDTLLPRYQFRHKASEVKGWFVEEGLDPIFHAHSYYTASSVPLPSRKDRAPAEALAAAGS